jgi:hypothetical protein
MSLSPPCFTEEDRFSLEALQTIHKQMDDDKDGGIEVDESDEVGGALFLPAFSFSLCFRILPDAVWFSVPLAFFFKL